MVDKHSQFAVTSTIPDKSAETILAFALVNITVLERQTGRVVKCVRTDGGREFDNSLLLSWLQSKGFVY